MNEQTRQILQMLAEGKITAEEAERLIDAIERGQPESATARPKYLRVVANFEDDRINVRVPLQLLRAGVRLTSLIPPQVLTRVNAELDKSGVPIDLTQLKPQHLEDLVEQLDDLTVDLHQADGKVQVFCE